ncbi:S8 family serine peptidase [Mesonia aquimarina]|uniref:S8 family serine peptidase n=1 Tax=Mesonia aquimarina TaxID=1504967 RepID=UPI000EF593F3|nr:S8 family serine peptidase [Mesonia aquimarina]
MDGFFIFINYIYKKINMKYKSLLSLALLSTIGLNAQTIEERKEISQNYNQIALTELYNNAIKFERVQSQKVLSASIANDWPIKVYENGNLIKQAFDITDDGMPIYTSIQNANASISTRTNFLNSGGSFEYDLDGEGMLIGLWDGGLPLNSHVEFTEGPISNISRIENGETSSEDFHATHVAGTLIARGAAPEAKGMAPKANVIAYDFAGDFSEIVSEVEEGLLISNHSYGTPIFNDNGNIILDTSVPGKYTGRAQSFDQLSYQAPMYLMVCSAGNEGSNSYSGSLGTNRDKLTNEKNSKNNLVIANAQDAQINNQGELINVEINPSSSQGPTDDRRIKPDITGNGTGLISASDDNNQGYGQSTGTSMSSPNVAGTLILLQELYNELNDTYMRSATLKGLALHTADDAGKPGPDEVFGWGLLNAKKAAETIVENNEESDDDKTAIIKELTLSQGETYAINVNVTGVSTLKASISWTDPAGNIANNQMNSSTPVLVNDLDIRISNDSDTYEPWRLNFFNPTGNAEKGDNTVDNIERVDTENANGSYTITVTHKDNLNSGSQDYSLIITGIEGGLSVDDSTINKITVWPNPVQNSVNFTSPNGFSDAEIKIYDLNGRIVKSYDNITSNKTFSADLSGVQTGVYIANLTDGNGLNIQKRIIKK